jgi:TATA-binding protein-associated factor Taf7
MSHYRQQPDLSGLNLEDLSKLEQDLQTRKRALEQAKNPASP